MEDLNIRRAAAGDLPEVNRLLGQLHRIHSVDEAARHTRVGTRLCESAFDYGRNHGFYNVVLNVWADNPDAFRFYEQIGMKVQKIGMETIL